MILRIDAKCSDMCSAVLLDEDGKVLKRKEGYVPSLMPGGGDDYIAIDIDVTTGKILNWKVPTVEKLKAFIGVDDED